MRVDPKVVCQDRIADRDMAARAFIVVAVVPEPAKSSSVMQLAVGTFCLETLKPGQSNLRYRLRLFAGCWIGTIFESWE